jgi:hypothetical protein
VAGSFSCRPAPIVFALSASSHLLASLEVELPELSTTSQNWGELGNFFTVWSFTVRCEEFSYIKNVLLSAAIVSALTNHSGLSLKRVR